MKKLLLAFSAFLLMAFATAQPSLQILDQFGNDITGTTITVYTASPTAELLESHLSVKNSGDVNLDVFVRRINNTTVNLSSNAFCFGINCYPPFIDTSQVATPMAAGEINTSFIGDYYPGGGRGISSITYEFYDNTSTAGKVAASVTVLYAVADVIDLLDEEDQLVNNSTIVVHSTDTSVNAYLDTKVKIRNNTSTQLIMYARRVDNTIVPGTMNTFCFGVCYPPDVDTSTVEVFIPEGAVDENFLADYYPNGIAGATSLTFEFFDNVTLGSPVTASVTIIFNISGVGVPEASAYTFNEPYPNPASRFSTFGYELPASTGQAYLSIRNMLGVELDQVQLDLNSGKAILDTESLPAGIYHCSLVTDGRVLQTKRLVVNH